MNNIENMYMWTYLTIIIKEEVMNWEEWETRGGGLPGAGGDVNTQCRILERIKKIKLKKKHQGINKAHLVCTYESFSCED